MELTSQKMRRLAPELDPLRLGTGWTPDELSKPQIIVESSVGPLVTRAPSVTVDLPIRPLIGARQRPS